MDIGAQNGALVLTETSTPYMCGSMTDPAYSLKVYQASLKGDFKAVFTIDQFVVASSGSGVHAYVGDTAEATEIAVASLFDTGGLHIKVSITHDGSPQEDSAGTSGTSGTITFQRAGPLLSVVASIGGVDKTLSSVFSTSDLRVGIALQGPYNAPDPPASGSVHVTDFQVTGGGDAVVSDTFDCNSVH